VIPAVSANWWWYSFDGSAVSKLQTPTMPPELVHTYGLQGNTGGGEAGPSKEEESQPHPSFGELALLYSKPRAATVVARTDGVLWSLHRNDYKVGGSDAGEAHFSRIVIAKQMSR
jgi:hypothetical protein